jgi:hypothetical protein
MATTHSSDNWKYAGQTDVTIADLPKTIAEYEAILGGTNTTISRVEEIIDDVITQIKTITEGSTYRNTPAFVGKVARESLKRTQFPQIYVGIANSTVKPEDDVATVFREEMIVYIVGYVKSQTDGNHAGNLTDLMESLIHDIKKVLLNNITGNINTERWFNDIHNYPITIERSIDVEQSFGEFAITFRAVSYAMDYENERV